MSLRIFLVEVTVKTRTSRDSRNQKTGKTKNKVLAMAFLKLPLICKTHPVTMREEGVTRGQFDFSI